MAKAGMRRPNPSEPHGTESNHKPKFEKNRSYSSWDTRKG